MIKTNNLIYLKDVTTLQLIQEKCIGCGICATVCPHRIFAIVEKKATIIEKDLCIECGACSKNCPVAAIKVEPGVGCVSAIIKGWLTGEKPSCGCENDTSCC